MLPIPHWYPSRIRHVQQAVCCEWMQLEGIPFTDPFFDETLLKARIKPVNSSRFRPTTGLEALDAWRASLPRALPPTAFIFHISRCGSTLLSQLLGLHPHTISLAEVPFFDDLIRLRLKNPGATGFSTGQLLMAAIQIYGQRRHADDRHLVIKLDSWHIFFWKQLRALYPDVPFFLLYRRPDEVVQSHRKLPGMHAVPGLIEPAVFGFPPDEALPIDLDRYLAQVLARYLHTYLEAVQEDRNTTLLQYAQGPAELLQQVAQRSGLPLDDAYLAQVAKRSGFHSKYPAQVFSPEGESIATIPHLEPAFAYYRQLEQLRTGLTSK